MPSLATAKASFIRAILRPTHGCLSKPARAFLAKKIVDMAGEHPPRTRFAHPQLTLKLAPDPGYERENFFISECNEHALAMIELWPSWPDPLLILIGPAGAGKSHLGAIWAARASATIQSASSIAAAGIDALAAKGPLLIEDADTIGRAEAQLFHLVN